MIPTPRPPRPVLLALCALLVAALSACGPEPTEIDRSPVAGMTAENPDSGRITGDEITEELPNQGTLEITGDPAVEGAAEVTCSLEGHGAHETLTFTFAPNAGEGAGGRLRVVAHDYHGDGEYEVEVTRIRQGGGRDYLESTGTGTAQIHKGTLLNTDAATHWIAATFEGRFDGEAGAGQAGGAVDRCYYFK